jgi:hypothetical protein
MHAVAAVVLYAATVFLILNRVRGGWTLEGFWTWTAGLPALVRVISILAFLCGGVSVARAFAASRSVPPRLRWDQVLLAFIICVAVALYMIIPQDLVGRLRVEGPAARDSGVLWYRVSFDAWGTALLTGSLAVAGAFVAETAALFIARRDGAKVVRNGVA